MEIARREEMKIEFISKETVTSSSPTPPHLKTFRLSLLDQLSPPTYMPLLLFYGTAGGGNHGDNDSREEQKKTTTETSERLKKFLSETLTGFYPFAGRVKLHPSLVVDCNDEGVHYSVAQVNRSLTDFLQNPEKEELHQLIPTNPQTDDSSSLPPPLLIQSTFFDCGGMALGLLFSHKIADAATILAFIKAWAKATTTTLGSPPAAAAAVPCFEATSLFRPTDHFPFKFPPFEEKASEKKKKDIYSAKRYVFDATKIAALKAKAASPTVKRPTRVEAVSALLWKCMVKSSKQRRRTSLLFWPANIRPRFVPPLSQNSFGNLIVPLAAQADDAEAELLSDFVWHLRNRSLQFGEKYANKLTSKDGGDENCWVVFDLFLEAIKTMQGVDADIYSQTSYCKFGFYDIDFGCGKPIWVRMGDPYCIPNYAMFGDTSDGEGVEAWVNFVDEEEMLVFESDSDLLAFASINPSPLQQ